MGRAIADRWVIFMTLLQHNLKVTDSNPVPAPK